MLPLLLGIAACGSESSPDAADEPSSASTPTPSAVTSEAAAVPDGAPACADVWSTDATLPRGYDGCVDSDGTYVPRDALGCSSGQVLVQYDDTFFAVVGGTVRRGSSPLADDRDYRAAVRSCRA